jgi:hypothetical protein
VIQLALCFIALLIAWRTSNLRDVAAVYAIVHIVFATMAGPPDEAVARYGHTLFYLCAAAEATIIIWTAGIRHDAAPWIIGCSAYNLAVHLLASISSAVMPVNPFWDSWNFLIRIGELSQIACIIVFSRPIWTLLQSWHYHRKRKKEMATWLAKLNPVG